MRTKGPRRVDSRNRRGTRIHSSRTDTARSERVCASSGASASSSSPSSARTEIRGAVLEQLAQLPLQAGNRPDQQHPPPLTRKVRARRECQVRREDRVAREDDRKLDEGCIEEVKLRMLEALLEGRPHCEQQQQRHLRYQQHQEDGVSRDHRKQASLFQAGDRILVVREQRKPQVPGGVPAAPGASDVLADCILREEEFCLHGQCQLQRLAALALPQSAVDVFLCAALQRQNGGGAELQLSREDRQLVG
eukprot:4172772-Prymnesium_polylepis.2